MMSQEIRSWPTQMGARPESNILFMADLTRIAWMQRRQGIRFRADDLLDAFLEAIGDTGTLVIPTFNYDLRPGERYDIRHTPTISGSLGQAALAHPAFARTLNPLHSFAVSGALKNEFLSADHTDSFGPGSSFALLHAHAFQLLALDMPLEPAFTYAHHVEQAMKVPYRRHKHIPLIHTDASGTSRKRTFQIYAKKPGYVNDFKALEPLLIAAGAMQKRQLEGMECIQVDLQRAHTVVAQDILRNNAKSIVRFTLKWWLRDIFRPVLKRATPSRSAMLTDPDAARTR